VIKIILGNVGSGKTALAVREMFINKFHRKTYTNIITTLKNNEIITPKMIIKQEITDYKTNRKTGEKEPIYKSSLNVDYWKNITEPINVILDEAHAILNARRSMSKINIIITDWLALIRRVLGQTESGYGGLVLISQLANRIDIIARDMATNILYCIMHFLKTCNSCGTSWMENSEMPEGFPLCPSCNSHMIDKHSHSVEVWHFASMQLFGLWKDMNQNTFFKHYFVRDIENYFHLYDTLQWDNLFSEFYY